MLTFSPVSFKTVKISLRYVQRDMYVGDMGQCIRIVLHMCKTILMHYLKNCGIHVQNDPGALPEKCSVPSKHNISGIIVSGFLSYPQ